MTWTALRRRCNARQSIFERKAGRHWRYGNDIHSQLRGKEIPRSICHARLHCEAARPHLIFVKSDWPAYKLAAKQTREIFRDYDPHFTAGSLDEASLDITDYLKTRAGHGTSSIVNLADSVVAEIRERCRIATGGLTCSAGRSKPNVMKIARDQTTRWAVQCWL